jgi:peptidoglycan hydrolase-like protein with peptidoglycan-binding domain
VRNRRFRDETLDDQAEDESEATPRRVRKDVIAWIGAGAASLAIMINALFLQNGPHPAPIFANKPPPAPVVVAAAPPARPVIATDATGTTTGGVMLPRPRPPEIEPVRNGPQRPQTEITADIQKELAKRGFYDGAADGLYGAKTDAAIRDFEQAAGLKPGSMLDENLLRTIIRSNAKPRPAAAVEQRSDPIAELLAPPNKVIAVQRALSDYGYGQIKPTGVPGPETQAAIEKFERDRKLPVTGQISENVTRELAAMTGRPLE